MQLKKKPFVWPLVAALAIAGGSYFGTVEFTRGTPAVAASPQQEQTAKPTPQPQTEAVAPASELSRAFRTVHHALQDAVVNINVVKKGSGPAAGGRARLQLPPQFRNMIPPEMDPENAPDETPDMQGTGSGVIVSADGYIVTNNHVVSGASEITVTLNDTRELKAELIGTDPKTDLAVIRIKADSLTFAKFGDSDALDVGDWVLAFGSPFGFSQTMTQGIISAKGRSHLGIIASHDPSLQGMTYENFLQTDAAINPGNSGGPLVNLKGEVVGINAAIASRTGAYNGIGFSIPSNDVRYVMDSLIKSGKVVRGYLGVKIEDLDHPAPADQRLADSIRKSGFKADGVLVNSVEPAGPAGQAGLQPGDVITQIDGKSFKTPDELRNYIARARPQSKLNLQIYRDGKTQPVSVNVGTQPEAIQLASQNTPRTAEDTSADSKDLGISVEDLTGRQAQRLGLTAGKGAIVARVAPNSLAGEMGLKPGDVVTRVDRTPITSARQFSDALGSAKLSDGVKLTVRGDDGMDRLVYIEKK